MYQNAKLQLLFVLLIIISVWSLLSFFNLLPANVVPNPLNVWQAFWSDLISGRIFNDLIASLFRVTGGFALAVFSAIPLGLWIGHSEQLKKVCLPFINFFRNLSPLAWIPFAILWFGIGDIPTIFLIFMAAFFPLALATIAATSNVPQIYYRVAKDYRLTNREILFQITLPAITPQLITALRVTAGLSWLVVVAAEMIAGRDGLGYAIWDARNGLRMDLLVVGMIIIGLIGIIMDKLLQRLTLIPGVRWAYEK